MQLRVGGARLARAQPTARVVALPYVESPQVFVKSPHLAELDTAPANWKSEGAGPVGAFKQQAAVWPRGMQAHCRFQINITPPRPRLVSCPECSSSFVSSRSNSVSASAVAPAPCGGQVEPTVGTSCASRCRRCMRRRGGVCIKTAGLVQANQNHVSVLPAP